MRQFVPMSDDVLYDPAHLPGPLVPYRCGIPCWHQLQAESGDRADEPPSAPPPRVARVSASP